MMQKPGFSTENTEDTEGKDKERKGKERKGKERKEKNENISMMLTGQQIQDSKRLTF